MRLSTDPDMTALVDIHGHGCRRCGSLTCDDRSASKFGVVVVGTAGTGKSAICVQLKTRRFIWDYDSSGDYTYQMKIPLGDHCSSLTIVDTTHRTDLAGFNFDLIHGILLVFSITDAHSFAMIESLKAAIEEAIAQRRIRPLRYLLVGNKTDLARCRQVSETQGQELASRLGCEYTEVSARIDGHRVHAAFQVLLHKMRAAKKRRAHRHWSTLKDQVSTNTSKTIIYSHTAVQPPPTNLTIPFPKFSSSSCDSLLSPTSPTGGSDSPDGLVPGQTSATPDDGLSSSTRRSLRKTMIQRVSSLRLSGRQRRNSKPNLESD